MALVRTTLTSPVGVNETNINVASATSIASGRYVRIDDEILVVAKGYTTGTLIPVERGRNGSVGDAHPVTASVTHGLPTDFAMPVQGGSVITYQTQTARTVTSYSAAGAISLPSPGSDAVAILNGTTLKAMTLANPGKDNDGDLLTIIGNGKAAWTVTYSAGLGNAGAGYTVGTFDTLGQCCMVLMAMNEIWVPFPSPVSGNTTAIDVAVA